MSRPILYLALDGPILVPDTKHDPYVDAGIAEYSKSFVHWAKDNFRTRWLTDRAPGHAFHVAKQLGLSEDAIPVLGFDVSKTEVISPEENFYWVDGPLIPGEVSWLAQHGHTGRFISVDPAKGITPEHKSALEALIRKR
jgi:hypothetical protein